MKFLPNDLVVIFGDSHECGKTGKVPRARDIVCQVPEGFVAVLIKPNTATLTKEADVMLIYREEY